MKKLILIILCLFSSLNLVKADELVDLNKKGSISITLKEEENNKYVSGAEIEIFKIGEAKTLNNNLLFDYVNELNDCPYKLSEENILDIQKCIQNKTLKSYKSTTINGKVKFNNLDLGIYYVKQNNKVKSFSQINSFLIMLPKEINNSFEYNIDATPKIEIVSLIDIKIKKVWNTDKKNKILDYVTIELYKNNEKIDTIILNEENNWEKTIEDLPKSDTYSVKEVNLPKGYTVSYTNNNYVFTVTNTPSLVQTGQMTYLYTLLSFIGLIFIIIGLIISRQENEK